MIVGGNKIFTANDEDATTTDLAEAIEKALQDAGYTDVKLTAGSTTVYGITAKKGGITVNFTLNPDSGDVAFVDEASALSSAIRNGKKTIYLATGTYELSGQEVNSDLTIIGNGNVTINADGGNGHAALKIITGKDIKLVVKGVNFVNAKNEELAIAIQGNAEGKQDATYTFEIDDCTFVGYSTAIQMTASRWIFPWTRFRTAAKF